MSEWREKRGIGGFMTKAMSMSSSSSPLTYYTC